MLNNDNLTVDGRITYVPVYMVMAAVVADFGVFGDGDVVTAVLPEIPLTGDGHRQLKFTEFSVYLSSQHHTIGIHEYVTPRNHRAGR